jgi:hypothetical protein
VSNPGLAVDPPAVRDRVAALRGHAADLRTEGQRLAADLRGLAF